MGGDWMSTLEKHPAPWATEVCCGNHPLRLVSLKDATGDEVLGSGGYENDEFADKEFADEEVKRLIAAAPVLLEALAVATSEKCPRDIAPFNLLSGWLNGESGYPEVNLEAFLKWLRAERTTVVIERGEGHRGRAEEKVSLEHVPETTYGVSPNPATALDRPAPRCHVCGAPAVNTHTFEHTYETQDHEQVLVRFPGIGLCGRCVPCIGIVDPELRAAYEEIGVLRLTRSHLVEQLCLTSKEWFAGVPKEEMDRINSAMQVAQLMTGRPRCIAIQPEWRAAVIDWLKKTLLEMEGSENG
jgi:hypothetical protein